MQFSDKQLSFIMHSDAFLNCADGSVRSGKTHAALYRFARFCLEGPRGDLAVFGKTERTVRRNVVNELKKLLPGAVKYVQGSGELFIFGRLCWVIGANNVAAEEKVRGMSLAGGYMNEVTLYPQEVVEQAFARSLVIPGAQFFCDMNPDSPYHWMMEKYLAAGLSKDRLKRWRFKLEDNPILTPDAMSRALELYPPGTLFHRRNILGEWVQAEGVIYDMFDERTHVVKHWPSGFNKVVVGVDYATATTTAFIMLGRSNEDGKWYAFREYYHDAIKAGRQKTDGEFASDLWHFLRGYSYPDPYGQLYPSSIEIDPSAASFKLECKRQGIAKTRDAENDVLDGIRTVGTALTEGAYLIHEVCENLRKEKTSYVWDEAAQEKGEDKPLKQYDHAQDAERYGLMRALGSKGLKLVKTA